MLSKLQFFIADLKKKHAKKNNQGGSQWNIDSTSFIQSTEACFDSRKEVLFSPTTFQDDEVDTSL